MDSKLQARGCSGMELPPLPPLNDKLHQLMRGPTLSSNWVVPGMVMAGAYPGALDDRENELQLKRVLNKGIDTFVCLQLELDDEILEEDWRHGNALRPYFVDARRYSKKPLIWRHLPILDGDAAPDDLMEALVCDLLDDLKEGRVLYVHCWGGHGRAGIVVCLLLAALYGISVTEAFKRVQAYHDCRIEPQGVKSPTTVVQRSQVKRLLQKWAGHAQGSATENAVDKQLSSANEEEPQVVIGKNGARGFVVDRSCPTGAPAMERAVSLPKMTKDESGELSLSRNHMKGPLSKPQPMLQSCPAMRNGATPIQRPISLHRSASATALATRLCTGRAAGTGAAAVQMIRKSAGKLALT